MKKGLIVIFSFMLFVVNGFGQTSNTSSTSSATSTQTEISSSQPVYINPMEPADEIFYFKYNAEYFSAKCQGNCESCPYNTQCSANCKSGQGNTTKPSVCQFKPISNESNNMDARLQLCIQLNQIK